MIDGLKTMYNDFYGPADDSGLELHADTSEKKPVRSPVAGKPVRVEPVSETPVVETEVVTEAADEKRYATMPEKEPDKPKEPEKSGMEELEELIGLENVKHDVKEMKRIKKDSFDWYRTVISSNGEVLPE